MLLHGGEMAEWTEALLFAAQRSELVSKVVKPALSEGRWVLSDRCFFSSLAYQGAARGLGVGRVWSINRPALDGVLPDPGGVAWTRITGSVCPARKNGTG